ncbi:MAG: hypothetical protein ACRC2V_19685 [Xenococcaceae cyanobacterium]
MNESNIEKRIHDLQCKLDANTVIIMDAIAVVKRLLEEIQADLKASKNQ